MYAVFYPVSQEALERWRPSLDTHLFQQIAQLRSGQLVGFWAEPDSLDILSHLNKNVAIWIKYDTLPWDFIIGPPE